MPRSANIYQRSGIVFVSASHQTQAGFWVDDDFVEALSFPQPAEVGRAVETALVRSREGVPTPPPSADLSTPLLAAAGVTSWNKFAKSAKYADALQNDDTIKVTPYRNLGGKDGFEPMSDKVILLSSGALSLGEAVASALEIAE